MAIEEILAGKGRHVVTIAPEQSLADAAEMLHRHRIGAVVVTDDGGQVAGILSERDVVRAVAEAGAGALGEPVSRRMTAEVVTCRPSCGLDELMDLMTRGKFRHVPVVESGRLQGIVSIGDIVKHRLAQIAAEHEAMRDYIATA
ncbi:MAG: CBS domain-containing protein [Methylobacteriaceae bacterium]|nr:CBS domain-containing protein [Methylobacteriaceae bacterium]